MNITNIRLNTSGKAIRLRLLVLVSAVVLATTGIVYGQNGKLRPEETALKNLRWRAIGLTDGADQPAYDRDWPQRPWPQP